MNLIPHSGFLLAISILSAMLTSFASSEELQPPDSGRKIKVFLFAGQSNMEGRASGRKLTEEDQSRLRNAQKRVRLAFNEAPIRPLDVVSPADEIREIYQRDQIFGPELFFGLALAEAMPNKEFLFIKRTEGGTSLHGCWNPDWSEDKATVMDEAKAPKLYHEFVAYIHKVLNGYSPDEYEICAMLWVQGESDSKVPESEAAYGATLRLLIERVRVNTGQNDLPFILFEVGSPQVSEGMKQCAAKVKNVTLIHQSQNIDSPDFYEKMQNGHYNYKGMKKLGTRFAQIFLNTHFTK